MNTLTANPGFKVRPAMKIRQAVRSGRDDRVSNKATRIILLALALHAAAACADDSEPSMLSFGVFGTLGLAHSSEDQADFVSTTFKPDGAGYTHAWSVGVDSLLGAQVTANLTAQLSALVQVITEQNYDSSYRPHVEWANIKYEFSPEFDIRVGRTELPIFMISDSRRIGYANTWVRPPIEVYSMVPLTINDGVDSSYRMHVGTATNTFQVTVGRSDSKFPNNRFGTGTAQSRNMTILADTFERGPLTAHFSYGRTQLTVPQFAPLFDAFRQFGPEGHAIAEKYGVDDRLVTFLGMGASYDPGAWFATGEWGHINTRSILGEKTGWFVSSGFRSGKLTPFLSYRRLMADSERSTPGLTLSGLPPVVAGSAAGLNATLNSVLGSIPVQQTISAGARWDFAKDTAFKVQFEHINLGAGSPGTLVNLQPGFQRGGKVNVLSIAVDFVY